MNKNNRLYSFCSILSFSIFIIFTSCSGSSEEQVLKQGNWLFELAIDDNDPARVLPFNAEVLENGNILIKNATENIVVTEISYQGDSVRFFMPVFGSEFKGKMENDLLTGIYIKHNAGPDYIIPFKGYYDKTYRFNTSGDKGSDFSGRWKSFFISDSDTSEAIGIFGQVRQKVMGTFLTSTGDYRYLEGVADGNVLKLSTFDGAHAFLFEAVLDEDGKINGTFRSGNSWETRWLASRDQDVELGDMKSLTYLNPGYDGMAFSFPDESGTLVSLEDDQFQNKVVILQIFGTWCPNCMDETRYLVELHNKYNDRGLEIIGLDFEPKPTLPYFKKKISRFRNDLNVPYTLLLAGNSNKQKANESLPMLNHILSYPTAIIIDRKGEIKEIHTGFTGPGTGEAYDHYRQETEQLIESLLQE